MFVTQGPIRSIGLGALVSMASIPAFAQAPQVSLAGSHIESITVSGIVIDRDDLISGRSSGQTTFVPGLEYPTAAADDFNLSSYFARNGVANPDWDVHFGVWWDTNGSVDDFFVFEVGGNDALSVRPILGNGSLGQSTNLSGWTSTGYVAASGANKGQVVHGLSFGISDLKSPTGNPLGLATRVRGLRFSGAHVDGAACLAVDPRINYGDVVKPSNRPEISKNPRVGYRMEVRIPGPLSNELDVSPNPFLDYRLRAEFQSPTGRFITVPGFFDGNGQGGGSGRIWKVRFAPDEPGPWAVEIHYEVGTNLAVEPSSTAGTPLYPNGATLRFDVAPRNPAAPGFLKWGPLKYAGAHYLKFDNGPYFIKAGLDSPENFLAYTGFDDPEDSGNLGKIHEYEPHRGDFVPGDPHFSSNVTGVDSKGIIGAINYLASQGINSVYLLPMNLGGDGQDVSPFVGVSGSSFDNTHYDVSRLDQWEVVFSHAQRKGILIHFVLAETEAANEQWLDNGQLGVERKLFYRELVARFAHHPAIKWNLCEENDYSANNLRAFADYIQSLDVYEHPICFHTHPNAIGVYDAHYGDPRFSASSIQFSPDQAEAHVEAVRQRSANAGRPWVVEMDENGPASTGLQPNNATDLRKRVLWDVLLSGGGIEWYLGGLPLPIGGDQDVEDLRTRQDMWIAMRIAREFMEQNLPFWEMNPADHLLTGESSNYGGGEVFAKPGQSYGIYLPRASSTGSLNLTGQGGTYLLRWFNPRTGNFEGSSKVLNGNGIRALGAVPNTSAEDWAAWVERQ